MRKFLFVGLGGSGGKTLRFLRRDLERWLQDIGYNGFPDGWQMLHIDTPSAQDGAEIKDVPMLPPSSYVGLVASGVDFSAVATKLDGVGGDGRKDLATWRVDPTFLNVPISVGAGQFRAVGRAIGLSYAGAISQAINTASNRLKTASAGSELAEIHMMATGVREATPADPVVVVVSSLAGGTGAGLLLDTCDILRQQGIWGGQSFGLLYASDVFKEIGGLGTGGVQPNSLAALSELMNAYWINSNWPRSNSFFDQGLAPMPVDRSGPAFPFLVGASNAKGITFGNQKSIYAMMGRALKSWTTDVVIQDRLVAYTIANWENTAQANVVKTDTLNMNHDPVFEAFGYAEVGLGTDRFARYSAQRLAKTAATWLNDGHITSAQALDPNDARTPNEIEDAIARDNLMTVLRDLRLNERSEADDVIDDLRPLDHESSFLDAVNNVLRLATDGVAQLNADQWTTRIAESIPAVAEEYERNYDIGLRTRAAEWVRTKPEQTIDAALNLARRFGLRVAARTFELVAVELKQVANELAAEAEEMIRISKDVRSNIRAELPLNGKYKSNNSQIEQAVSSGLWTSAGYTTDANRKKLALQLMTEFAEGFIEPLAKALRYAFEDLRLRGFLGDGDEPPVVDQWPEESVPDELRPPPNEFLVVSVDRFASTYSTLLSRSTQSELPQEKANEARDAVIDGLFLSQEQINSNVARPIMLTKSWAPTRGLTLGSPLDRSNATFETNFDPQDLVDRAERYLRRPGSAFDRFLTSDLRSYLNDDPLISPQEMAGRRSSFLAAFRSALDAAEPLVNLNQGLRTLMHPTIQGRRAVPSTLPFRDHPLEGDVRDVLHSSLGIEEGDRVAASLSTSTDIRAIAISATLGAAHDPIVFDSITSPIIAGWSAAVLNQGAMVSFWRNRRARPLREFVPVSQEVLVAMARGWFTGTLLGLIDWETRKIVYKTGPVTFSENLLTPAATPKDRLPALLESLGIAYCEVAKASSVRPLHPYMAMRDLGLAENVHDMKQANLYRSPNKYLTDWVRSGRLDDALVEGLADRAAKKLGTDLSPADRVKVLLDRITETLKQYQDSFDEYLAGAKHHPEQLGVGYGIWYGMSDVIFQALKDLERAVKSITIADDMEM